MTQPIEYAVTVEGITLPYYRGGDADLARNAYIELIEVMHAKPDAGDRAAVQLSRNGQTLDRFDPKEWVGCDQQELLDDAVTSAFCDQAADINNAGREAQIRFLLKQGSSLDLARWGITRAEIKAAIAKLADPVELLKETPAQSMGLYPYQRRFIIQGFLGQEPEDFQVLEVNSGHIPEVDHNTLALIVDDAEDDHAPPHASGLIVYMANEMPQVYLGNLFEVDRELIDLAPETWAILDAAAAAGYRRVEFDGSGQVYPNLPTFNW